MSDANGEFTTLDWIGTIVAGCAVAALAAFPYEGRSFDAMFRDFGAREQLPLLTRLALTPWFPELLSLPAVVALVIGLRGSAPLKRRRLAVVTAFCLGVIGLGVCLAGVYEPIFDVAGKVRSPD